MWYTVTNALFYSNFRFNEYSHLQTIHVDNSLGVNSHFIGLMKKGTAQITSEKYNLQLKEGDLFYIPKGLSYHSHWYPDGDSVDFYSYAFQNIPVPHNQRYKLQLLNRTDSINEKLSILAQNRTTGCRAIGLFYLLLSELLDTMQTEKADYKQEIVDKSRCYMLSHDVFSISDVAKYCSVSESGFYAIYKQVTGTTPQEVKNRIRIDKCHDLLAVDGLSVEQVSEKMGFSSSSYFRKVFKKYTGTNPSQVRKGAKISMP